MGRSNQQNLSNNGQILTLQNRKCFYCREPLSRVESTRDHFFPYNNGARTLYKNKVLCHFRCNRIKGDREPSAFEVYIFGRMLAGVDYLTASMENDARKSLENEKIKFQRIIWKEWNEGHRIRQRGFE